MLPFVMLGFLSDIAIFWWVGLAGGACFASYGYWRHRSKRKLRVGWKGVAPRVWVDGFELEFPLDIRGWQETRETTASEGGTVVSYHLYLRLTDARRQQVEFQEQVRAPMGDWSDSEKAPDLCEHEVFVVSGEGEMNEIRRVVEEVNTEFERRARRR